MTATELLREVRDDLKRHRHTGGEPDYCATCERIERIDAFLSQPEPQETDTIEFEAKPSAEPPVYDHMSVQFADDSCMKVTGARVAMNGKIVELVPKEAEPVMSAEEVREACAKECEKARSDVNADEYGAWAHGYRAGQRNCVAAIRSLDLSRKEKANE